MSFYGQNFLDDFNMDTDYSNVDYTSPFLPSYTPPTVGPVAPQTQTPTYSDILRGLDILPDYLTGNYGSPFNNTPTTPQSGPLRTDTDSTTPTTTTRGLGGSGVTNKTPSIAVPKPDNSVPKYNEDGSMNYQWAKYYNDPLNIFGGAPLPGQDTVVGGIMQMPTIQTPTQSQPDNEYEQYVQGVTDDILSGVGSAVTGSSRALGVSALDALQNRAINQGVVPLERGLGGASPIRDEGTDQTPAEILADMRRKGANVLNPRAEGNLFDPGQGAQLNAMRSAAFSEQEKLREATAATSTDNQNAIEILKGAGAVNAARLSGLDLNNITSKQANEFIGRQIDRENQESEFKVGAQNVAFQNPEISSEDRQELFVNPGSSKGAFLINKAANPQDNISLPVSRMISEFGKANNFSQQQLINMRTALSTLTPDQQNRAFFNVQERFQNDPQYRFIFDEPTVFTGNIQAIGSDSDFKKKDDEEIAQLESTEGKTSEEIEADQKILTDYNKALTENNKLTTLNRKEAIERSKNPALYDLKEYIKESNLPINPITTETLSAPPGEENKKVSTSNLTNTLKQIVNPTVSAPQVAFMQSFNAKLGKAQAFTQQIFDNTATNITGVDIDPATNQGRDLRLREILSGKNDFDGGIKVNPDGTPIRDKYGRIQIDNVGKGLDPTGSNTLKVGKQLYFETHGKPLDPIEENKFLAYRMFSENKKFMTAMSTLSAESQVAIANILDGIEGAGIGGKNLYQAMRKIDMIVNADNLQKMSGALGLGANEAAAALSQQLDKVELSRAWTRATSGNYTGNPQQIAAQKQADERLIERDIAYGVLQEFKKGPVGVMTAYKDDMRKLITARFSDPGYRLATQTLKSIGVLDPVTGEIIDSAIQQYEDTLRVVTDTNDPSYRQAAAILNEVRKYNSHNANRDNAFRQLEGMSINGILNQILGTMSGAANEGQGSEIVQRFIAQANEKGVPGLFQSDGKYDFTEKDQTDLGNIVVSSSNYFRNNQSEFEQGGERITEGFPINLPSNITEENYSNIKNNIKVNQEDSKKNQSEQLINSIATSVNEEIGGRVQNSQQVNERKEEVSTIFNKYVLENNINIPFITSSNLNNTFKLNNTYDVTANIPLINRSIVNQGLNATPQPTRQQREVTPPLVAPRGLPIF
tara:strand:+ start:6508 stop:9975 length:3468 start_codon:yes stop_codon:yes gene_type:complete